MSFFTRRASLALVLAVGVAVVASACGGGQKAADTTKSATPPPPAVSGTVPPDAIALVGGEKILRTDFDLLLKQAKQGYDQQGQKFPAPGTPEYEKLKSQAVDYLVQRAEFRQEAKAMGIVVTPADVDKKLADLKQQYFGGDEAKFQAEMKKAGLTLDQVKTDLEARIVSDKLFAAVTKDVQVSDADVQKYYDDNKDQYPPTRDVRHILVKTKAKADDVFRQLQGGADFAKLAKKYSTDPGSKDNGGEYKAVGQGQFVPEFDKYLFDPSSKTGVVSEPIKTKFGWHLIEPLSDIKETTFDSVKDQIRQQLLKQKKNDAMSKWVAGLPKKYDGKIVYAVGYAPPPPVPSQVVPGQSGQSGASTSSSG